MTSIEHYKEQQKISESEKNSLRRSTKFHTNKLQKAQKIFGKYMEDPSQILHEVDILV